MAMLQKHFTDNDSDLARGLQFAGSCSRRTILLSFGSVIFLGRVRTYRVCYLFEQSVTISECVLEYH